MYTKLENDSLVFVSKCSAAVDGQELQLLSTTERVLKDVDEGREKTHRFVMRRNVMPLDLLPTV